MYSLYQRRHHAKLWLIVGAAILVVLTAGVIGLRSWYNYNLRPLTSATSTTRYFTVESGSSLSQIASNLKKAELIRNAKVFETYVRGSELHDKLKAGTYSLSSSLSVQEIVKKMVDGEVARDLLTILPGKRLDEIKQAFAKAGYSQVAIDAAFNPSAYRDHPVLESLPAGASLEGYLYPESFQKEINTPAEVVIRKSLDEMNKHLTPDIKAGFAAQGLNTFQGIIMASMILQESGNPEDQKKISQVFHTRLRRDMMLQSDPTADYATAIAGVGRNLRVDSPYNTYVNKGLPPGPISNTTEDAMIAVARPAATDFLYFVAEEGGNKTYFSRTIEEHQKAIEEHCRSDCGQ